MPGMKYGALRVNPGLAGHKRIWGLFIVLLALVTLTTSVEAGTHKLSRWNKGVFDLVVSLDWDPTKQDEDYLDKIFNLFAEDVWRMTEGHHSLGTLYIYTPDSNGKARYWDRADIIMKNGNDSQANATVNGFLHSGGRIYIYDKVSDVFEIGHSLAHEMGHYAYGFFDEYAQNSGTDPDDPHKDDTPTKALMANHRKYWRFSTAEDCADKTQRKTAHWRMYEASCWGVMVRDPKDDPTGTRFDRFIKLGLTRKSYADLIELESEPELEQPTDYPDLNIVYDPSDKVVSSAQESSRMLAEINPKGFLDVDHPPTGLTNATRNTVVEDSDGVFYLTAEITGGEYPEPILVRATVLRDQYLKQVNVVAYITEPSGNVFELPLLDDGETPDEIAGDGVYTGAAIDYENVTYPVVIKANNDAGTAVETTKGLFVKIGTDPKDIPVPEPFQLQAEGEITCSGVVADDHGKNFDEAGLLSTDGALEPGRLEENGDTDYFYFNAKQGESYTIFTTGLYPLTMRTKIKLYESDQIAIATSNAAETGDGTDYKIIWTCPSDGLYYLTVQHQSSGQGIYNLAARLTQPSDNSGGWNGDTGGSSGGCFLSNMN